MLAHARRQIAASLALIVTIAAASLCAAEQLAYTGVNLAGAEFGEGVLPGNYGQHYLYPNAAEVDYFVDKGLNTFRIPFRWERLQRTLGGALDATELDRLTTFVNHATSQGAHVILDPHNYARYHGNVIGGAGNGVTNAHFADFWSRVANAFKSNDRVIFGLMNEPNSMPTEQWLSAANAALASIRTAGAENLVLVPGNAWTGAHSWSDNWYGTPNAAAMLGVVDPGNNYAFDLHQYLDGDSSGTSATIVNENIGVTRLTGVTDWLRTNNRRGFLGEFAAANSTFGGAAGQIGDEAIDNMLDYVEANDDVWLGWTWWAAGPWWQEYQFTLEPTGLGSGKPVDRAALAALTPHLAPPNAPVLGDYNGDGAVNGEDLETWQSQYAQTGPAHSADGNSDNMVDGHDFLLWQRHVQTASATTVPEPSALLISAILWLSIKRVQQPTILAPSTTHH